MSLQDPRKEGVFGQESVSSSNSLFNALIFLMTQVLSGLNVATLARVVSVSSGGVGPAGTVDVLPLVNQVDGSGSPVKHGVIYGLPYFRLHGGINAVICDPQPGDIGFCIFADRDISSVKASLNQANPASKRMFDLSDGLFVGGWPAGSTPVRYVRVSDDGIEITTPDYLTVNADDGVVTVPSLSIISNTEMHLTSPTVQVHGNLQISGGLSVLGGGGSESTMVGDFHLTGSFDATGEITADSVKLSDHVHTGVTTGGSNTGGPL